MQPSSNTPRDTGDSSNRKPLDPGPPLPLQCSRCNKTLKQGEKYRNKANKYVFSFELQLGGTAKQTNKLAGYVLLVTSTIITALAR